jgi:sugar/nucleoside kinase (ribokinase family)
VGAAFLAARLGSRRVFERLANANLIFADEEEANVLTGLAPELAASALAESFEIAVVKTGASGAVAASRFGVVRAAPAAPHPIGPTAGAGDALDAGVLIGLSAGLELEPALVLGMRAAQWALGR